MMIRFSAMGPTMADAIEGSPEWHEAVCHRLQAVWESRGRHNVKDILEQTTRIVENESWRYVPQPDGTEIQRFCEELIGEPWDTLLGIVAGLDPDLARRLSLKLKAPVPARDAAGKPAGSAGGNQYTANSLIEGKSKGSKREKEHARRLRRDRPELWEAVERGDKSLNKAAIEAGFRRRMVQVEPTVEGFDRAIAKHLPEYKLVLR